MKPPLVLAFILLAIPALSQEPDGKAEPRPAAPLIALSDALDRKLEDKKNAILSPQAYEEFARAFRVELNSAVASVPSTPENKGYYAEILARLDGTGKRALANLDEALKADPKNPSLLRAKAQILYDQKDFPAAARAAREAGVTADGILKMSQGRDVGTVPTGTVTTIRPDFVSTGAKDDDKPYKLAVQAKLKSVDVPLESVQPKPGPKFHSNSIGLWGQAADGLVMRGSEWISSADAMGENGLSAVGKFMAKGGGKGFMLAGGLMDASPGAATWVVENNFRLMTGDVMVVPEIGRVAYAFGKTAVVGFADDARVATNDWGDLVTLKKPTTYQALKATARTEAILANFLPFGSVSKGGNAALTATEIAGETAGRRALLEGVEVGVLETVESDAAHSAIDGDRLAQHLKRLQKEGSAGFKEMQDGEIRYYERIKPADKPGRMMGMRRVSEWNPTTGRSRVWFETVDHDGVVRIVRPETGGSKIHYLFDEKGEFSGKR